MTTERFDAACEKARRAALELDTARAFKRLDPQRYANAQFNAHAAFDDLVRATSEERDLIYWGRHESESASRE
jgi:hypothetical protein